MEGFRPRCPCIFEDLRPKNLSFNYSLGLPLIFANLGRLARWQAQKSKRRPGRRGKRVKKELGGLLIIASFKQIWSRSAGHGRPESESFTHIYIYIYLFIFTHIFYTHNMFTFALACIDHMMYYAHAGEVKPACSMWCARQALATVPVAPVAPAPNQTSRTPQRPRGRCPPLSGGPDYLKPANQHSTKVSEAGICWEYFRNCLDVLRIMDHACFVSLFLCWCACECWCVCVCLCFSLRLCFCLAGVEWGGWGGGVVVSCFVFLRVLLKGCVARQKK